MEDTSSDNNKDEKSGSDNPFSGLISIFNESFIEGFNEGKSLAHCLQDGMENINFPNKVQIYIESLSNEDKEKLWKLVSNGKNREKIRKLVETKCEDEKVVEDIVSNLEYWSKIFNKTNKIKSKWFGEAKNNAKKFWGIFEAISEASKHMETKDGEKDQTDVDQSDNIVDEWGNIKGIKDSMSSVFKIIGIEGDDKEKAMKGVDGFFDICSGLGIDLSDFDKSDKPDCDIPSELPKLSFLNEKPERSLTDVAIETIKDFNRTKKNLQTILEILSPDELKIVEEQCDTDYTGRLSIIDTKINNLSENSRSIEEKLDNIELNLDIVITKISKL